VKRKKDEICSRARLCLRGGVLNFIVYFACVALVKFHRGAFAQFTLFGCAPAVRPRCHSAAVVAQILRFVMPLSLGTRASYYLSGARHFCALSDRFGMSRCGSVFRRALASGSKRRQNSAANFD